MVFQPKCRNPVNENYLLLFYFIFSYIDSYKKKKIFLRNFRNRDYFKTYICLFILLPYILLIVLLRILKNIDIMNPILLLENDKHFIDLLSYFRRSSTLKVSKVCKKVYIFLSSFHC